MSPLTAGHRYFGTGIITYTNAIGFYAIQNFNTTQSIPTGTTLYAPTLLGSNYCPLEITTEYVWVSGVLQRAIGVWDHNSNQFVVSDTNVTPFLNSSNQYIAEIYDNSGTWEAMVYDYSISQWLILYTDSTSTTSMYGFDIWEEYNFNESSWPVLGTQFDSSSIEICISGTWHNITSTYGNQQADLGTAPYTFTWTNQYYHWHVK